MSVRIIPARAGFTSMRTQTRAPRSDHPRSRGVYASHSALIEGCAGSSPLARGLLLFFSFVWLCLGIIPARAGFTPTTRPASPGRPDHPRSRGVYAVAGVGAGLLGGSSPLARGLHGVTIVWGANRGIIPARAGFTRVRDQRRVLARDHPRSRGVYWIPVRNILLVTGSSPLARGLRLVRCEEGGVKWIIPARAGFTIRGSGVTVSLPDHPRSRGVYTCGSLESQRWPTLSDRFYLHW